jgi:hypothetical protein
LKILDCHISAAAALLAPAVFCGAVAARVMYVDAGAPTGGDGSSWQYAYHRLGDALSEALGGDVVRVAGGLYRPAVPPDQTPSTFDLASGAAVYGGYAGFGETDPNTRDVHVHRTVLGGPDPNHLPAGYPDTASAYSYVVTAVGVDAGTVLDGLTISAGHGYNQHDRPCGGIYAESSQLRVANCVISGSFAEKGAAIRIAGGAPFLNNCVIAGNTAAGDGAAIHSVNGSPTIVNCTITGNTGGGLCGGVFSDPGAATIVNCIIWGNTDALGTDETRQVGGPGTVVRYSCVENWPEGRGTGNISTDPLFGGNAAGDFHLLSEGGRFRRRRANESYEQAWFWVIDDQSSPCIDSGDPAHPVGAEPEPNGGRVNMGAWGNTPQASKSILHVAGDTNWDRKVDLVDFAILARHWMEMMPWRFSTRPGPYDQAAVGPEWSAQGGAVYHVDIRGSDANDGLTRQTAFANIQMGVDAAQDGDTVLVWPGEYQVWAIEYQGKAITVRSAADAAVLEAPYYRAFDFTYGETRDSVLSNFVIRNCNVAVYIGAGSPTLSHLTIVESEFAIDVYGDSNPLVTDCIIWDNNAADVSLLDGQTSQCEIRYSCMRGLQQGPGNMDADPLFAGPEFGDYHLLSGTGRYMPMFTDLGMTGPLWILDDRSSPCIDAGDPARNPCLEPFPNGGRVNMGAYGATEYASRSFKIIQDFNCDGALDMLDLLLITNNWLGPDKGQGSGPQQETLRMP